MASEEGGKKVKGNVEIKINGDVKVKSGGGEVYKTSGNVGIKAIGDVVINASEQLVETSSGNNGDLSNGKVHYKVSGNGTANFTVNGVVKVKASESLEVTASGTVEIKASKEIEIKICPYVEDKVFKDPVHGSIRIPALCVSIIDTPQFQRLRRIQQLGGVSYVYYGATHTRFEHRIGVCYLAGQLLEHLQKEQPELEINGRDILCVQVASLCRDLGSGPFSFIWEKKIREQVGLSKLKHEKLTEIMFNYLVKENKLKETFMRYLELSNDEGYNRELTFIRELIAGAKIGSGVQEPWPMEGRDGSKAFLYNIISNKENEIDVDKWDYLARDCHYLGVENSFDHMRLMNFARVLTVSDPPQVQFRQICYRDKEASHVYEMFHTRIRLHQKAYQHKTVKAIECMLADAIILAKDSFTFPTENGLLKESVEDSAAYEELDDTLISRIRRMPCSGEGNLKTAQGIIQSIEERNIYRCVQSKPIYVEGKDTEILEKEFAQAYGLSGNKFSFEFVTFEYGKESSNPVDKVFFYEKSNPEKAIKIPENEVSLMLPKTFRETRLLLICKPVQDDSLTEDRINDIKKMFEEYCRKFAVSSRDGGANPSSESGVGSPHVGAELGSAEERQGQHLPGDFEKEAGRQEDRPSEPGYDLLYHK